MNLAFQTTCARLFFAVLFSLISVFVTEPVAFGDLLVAPKVGLPKVTNPKLSNLVDNLYKGAKGPNPIGTGSTADAVRNELITGLPTHGRFHTQKAQETINGLTNWLRKNPSASHHDRLVAQSLLDDLKAALGGN